MVLKFGILPYDEPKEFKAKIETPKKLTEFKYDVNADFRSVAQDLASAVYDELNGKDHFRFYATADNGMTTYYQVNFNREGKAFFEEELFDDLNVLNKRKTLIK